MTSPVTGVTGTGNVPGTTPTQQTPTAPGGSLLDPQAFLQLLVAQLKYQDPTNPTDTSTFMNQTAMLSQVQTMNSMSSTLSELAQSQQVQSATSMIGKQITYTDANGATASGVVSSANLAPGGATLLVGTTTVPIAKVVSVTQPTTTTATTP
ncbi:flagellar hook assembly protein FlgD [Jatrophihabitans fulvus]